VSAGQPERYSQQASAALDRLETTASDPLWNAICGAIDLIFDHPGSAEARRESLRTENKTAVWRVTVRVPGEDDDWVILWQGDGSETPVIAYIGHL
jgi:hypothetical protein